MKNPLFLTCLRTGGVLIFFILLLIVLPLRILAQETIEPGLYESVDPRAAERTADQLKSASSTQGSGYTTNWNGSYYSDYFIYFQYYDYTYSCDCSDHKYQVTLSIIGGSSYNLGTVSGSTYTGLGLDLAVGPSASGTYNLRANEQGTDNYVWPICWTSCGHYWYNLYPQYYYTSAIRNPVSPRITGTWDYRIDIAWTEDSDIPINLQGYIIYRDGTEIGRVFNGVYNFSDTQVGPNETHTYTIKTIYPNKDNPTHISSGVNVTGKTFDLGLEATTNQTGVVVLTWNDANGKGKANLTEYTVKRYDPENNTLTTIPTYISPTTTDFPDDNALLVPGYMYKYTLQPQPAASFFPDTAWGKTLPNGELAGIVRSPSELPVVNVRVCAERITDVPQDTTSLYCAVTDTAGKFIISNIYYYDDAEFKLTPYKEDHGFSPGSAVHRLQLEPLNKIGGLLFIDTSAFTVTGQIVQNFDGFSCPVPNVDIYLDTAANPETRTDEKGMYALSVGQIGEYTITPMLDQHHFHPVDVTCKVSSDTTLKTIVDSTTFMLSGYVVASCDTYVGRAQLMITSGTAPDYCLDTVIMTDTLTGYYEIELPARTYSIEVQKFFSENLLLEDETVESYFTALPADLTFGDDQVNFVYRSEPELNILGFLEYGCGDYADVPIIEQGFQYTVTFEVKDVFQDHNCLADTGLIIVQNHLVSESNRVDTLPISGGMAEYKFIPGGPNLISPYLKNLTATAYIGKEFVQKSVDVLVEGNRAREQTFTTVSPEIPFMILRDPPGDASYSYLEQNTVTQTSMRLSGQVSGSLNVWAEVKLGTKFQLGIFGSSVETEIWGKVRGSLEVGASVAGQEEFNLSITNGENFKTSGNQDITGESGDVFAGSAMNMIYALTDVVKYNPNTCGVDKTVSLIMGVDDFATTFLYTENHIRNVLLPQLAYFRDYYERKDNDSAAIYSNQIDVWQQVLKLNQDLKQRSEKINNYSFSSGSSYESYQEISTTKSWSLQFGMYIESTVAAEAGIEIAGSGGSAGVEAKFRVEMGADTSVSETFTKRTGFYLDDDDAGDYFSVDILADHEFGTPVFRVVSGRSSCPWESGTQPREGVSLTSDSYSEFVDDPAGQAVFHLSLGNISQSDEDRFYNLVFDQASNPDGAVLTLGGSQVQGGIPTPYYILAGGSKEATVTVKRGPEAFDYDNLQFTLFSYCDDEAIRDTVLLGVHFKSTCSAITLTKPIENWVLASPQKDILKAVVGDYDRDLLDYVRIEIAKAGVNNWQVIDFIDKTDLDPAATTRQLMLGEYPDGDYELRAMVECSSGRAYSDIVAGIIDRRGPELYGLPEPSDLVLDEGDQIMAVFNEEVNCYRISTGQLVVKDLSTGETLDADLGCNGNTITVIPDLTGMSFAGDTFNVEISGIEDMYGNVMKDPASWTFVMQADPTPSGDEDTDLDGIKNSLDNCPYSANAGQEDMDTDGIGDVCDPDLDGDGVLNQVDNCVMTANADQKDENQDGIGDACQDFTGIPDIGRGTGYQFFQNYPNPFSGQTTLRYVVPAESRIIMRIFDVTGQEIAVLVNRTMPEGTYEVTWDAGEFSDGIYFCTIYAESRSGNDIAWKTIKLILSR